MATSPCARGLDDQVIDKESAFERLNARAQAQTPVAPGLPGPRNPPAAGVPKGFQVRSATSPDGGRGGRWWSSAARRSRSEHGRNLRQTADPHHGLFGWTGNHARRFGGTVGWRRSVAVASLFPLAGPISTDKSDLLSKTPLGLSDRGARL